MIERSAISNRSVYEQFVKFQRTASDHKFRAKSFRLKTTNNDLDKHLIQKIGLPVIHTNQSFVKIGHQGHTKSQSIHQSLNKNQVKLRVNSYKIVQKNYEQELNQLGLDAQFLHKLFDKKSEQTDSKYSQHKFQVFLKNLSQRMSHNKSLALNQMGFGQKSLQMFFEWYVKWQGHITEIDLTYGDDLLKESKMDIVRTLLRQDEKLLKIKLCNSSLSGEDIEEVFDIVNQRRRIFSLDLGNVNSQSLNRVPKYDTIETFCNKNNSVAILKLNNINLKSQGFEYLCRGVTSRRINPLRNLSLSSNHINGARIVDYFYNLIRTGLTHLDLSSNPLGDQFFKNLPPLKEVTLKELNLSDTQMNSENLYNLFQKIEECKSLTVLKADNNDFSHHWFGKIGQKLQVNSSMLHLSLNNCQIATLLPFFQGLIHNKFLKKLDVNHNCVDCMVDIGDKIVDFFTFNKELQELRLKFCNLSEDFILKIIQGISNNKKLQLLDLSQNSLQDHGGTQILKMLDNNSTLNTLGIQKLQISQQMKKRIHLKVQQNRAIRQRDQLGKLKNQTKQIKSNDNYTWEDLSQYEAEENRLNAYCKKLEEKTHKLEEKLVSKKNQLTQLIKDHKEQEQLMEKKMQDKIRMNNQKIQKTQKEYNRLIDKAVVITQEQETEKQMIQRYQQKIKEVNQKNKIRENELQDNLRNQRYLQRKNKNNPISPRKNDYNCPSRLK